MNNYIYVIIHILESSVLKFIQRLFIAFIYLYSIIQGF